MISRHSPANPVPEETSAACLNQSRVIGIGYNTATEVEATFRHRFHSTLIDVDLAAMEVHQSVSRPADSTRPSLISNVSLLAISRTFNSLFKVLFIFPSRYLFAIGLLPIFSFRWNIPPDLGCIPKQPDSWWTLWKWSATGPCTGLSPSMTPLSRGLMPCANHQKYHYKLQFSVEITNLSWSLFIRHY